MRRGWAAVGATAVVLGLAACSGSGGGDSQGTSPPAPSSPRTTAPTVPHTPVATALQLLPRSVTRARFVDQTLAFRHAGLHDVSGADAKDRAAFQKASATMPAYAVLALKLPAMKDWGWNGLDVQWEVQTVASGPPLTIDRIRDGVDMAAVVRSFEKEGFTSEHEGDVVRLTPPKDYLQRNPDLAVQFMKGVTVVPDRHLLVFGGEKPYQVPSSSMRDRSVVQTVTADAGRPEILEVAVGRQACSPPAEDPPTSGEDPARLHRMAGWAMALPEVGRATVTAAYASPRQATADRAGRTQLLENGRTHDSVAYSELFTASVTSDGTTLTYDLTSRGGPVFVAMVSQQDAPWSRCSTG